MKKIEVILLIFLLKCVGYSLADETQAMIGSDLIGDNVCKRVEDYNVTVVVSESVPYKERQNSWCWSVPPRCSQYKVVEREEKRVEVLTKTRGIKECCEGYIQLGVRCFPYCENPCYHGTCIATGVCKCDLKYGGPACDISEFSIAHLIECSLWLIDLFLFLGCPQGQWGKNCILKCNCQNKGYCDPYDGKCHCRKGYTGFKCDMPCPEGQFGLNCTGSCDCKNGAKCDAITGECLCVDGFKGLLCEDHCELGNNIDQCKSESQCENGGSWHGIAKKCECTPGWTGLVCEQACPLNFFGENCSEECSCLNNATCDHISGE